MPELPEVETVVRGLRPGLVGRRITGIEMAGRSSPQRSRTALRQILLTPPAIFNRTVCRARVADVRRYGKNIVILLDPQNGHTSQAALLIHLGMTGRLTWETSAEPQRPHTHVVFELDEPGRWLHYSDPRRFGKMRVAASGLPEDTLGPDPLEITVEEFQQRLSERRTMIKALLLDQRFLRGMGNIYADESLFRAGIHPAAIASRLSPERALRLHRSMREVLTAAIQMGGSSISDYVDSEGRSGWFQQEHQVYQRTGQPCTACGSPIKRMTVASRSSHFCAHCQTKRGRQ